MEALFSYLLKLISNSYNLFTESQVLSLMRSCVCTGEGTPSKSSSIGREEIPSSSLTLAPIQLTEKRLEAGSGCWLQSSPSVSGPPKTRGSCWSLPELQAMLKIAPMAAPACSVENEFKEVGRVAVTCWNWMQFGRSVGCWPITQPTGDKRPGSGPGRHLSSRRGAVSLCNR